jgi:hypothetical protein
MSTEDGQGGEEKKEGDALVAFLLENRTLMNFASILMIVFAVWATIEVITNAYGATWWPPETGIPAEDLFNNPDRTQNINNGLIIGLGAVCGTLGFLIQYFYRAAPYVDASMAATAAIIIKQATAGVSGVVDAEEVIAKAEVAATIAADTAIRKQLGDDDSPSEETIEPVETATEEKIEEPVEEPVEEPAEEPAEEPVEVKEVKEEKVEEKVEEKATKSKSGDSISSRKF